MSAPRWLSCCRAASAANRAASTVRHRGVGGSDGALAAPADVSAAVVVREEAARRSSSVSTSSSGFIGNLHAGQAGCADLRGPGPLREAPVDNRAFAYAEVF